MIKIWDVYIRLNHWLIVLLVASAWLSSEFGDAEFKWHSINGYIIFVLVLSRIVWGIIGSTTARFSNFIASPFKAIQYLLALRNNKATNYLGHNPAGGWMVIAFLLVLLGQTITGMLSSDDVLFEGPFSYYISSGMVETMTGIHHLLFNILMVLVGLHIAAVLYHQLIKNEKIIQAMFSGKKHSATDVKKPLSFRPFYIALTVILLVAFSFWLVLKNFG